MGFFNFTANLEQLVEYAIWNRLTPDEKNFLLSVSIMDSFTDNQAAILIGREILPDNITELIKTNDFIRYLPDKHQYSVHSILLDYLRNHFYHRQSREYQNQIFRRAGQACAIRSQYSAAAKLFYKVKDFDSILSLPLSCEHFESQTDPYQPELAETIINECPEETLCKYPFTLLVLGYQMFSCGRYESYRKICEIISLIIQKETGYEPEELQRIRGEYTLLASMREYNDLTKLMESQKAALEILGKPSEIIKNSTIWGYTTPSVLGILWRESGSLERTVQQLDEMSVGYRKLTQGQGAGAKSILNAESMLMRGEDNEAEILCHKALYDARGYKQTNICLCAELILARIAILRGDVEGYFTAIKKIQGYAKENSDLSILRIAEHCMSIISLLLGIKDYVVPWLYDLENIKKVLPAPVVPIAQILPLQLLLMDKRYNEFYGVCQLALDTSRNSTGNIKYMMPQVYQLLFLAIAKRKNGRYLEAQKHIKDALEITLPDQIYLPFAEQEGMVDIFSELTLSPFNSAIKTGVTPANGLKNTTTTVGAANGVPSLFSGGGGSFDALLTLCKRQQKGVSAIRKAVLQEKSPLTPREREIAQLAKERLSAKEIADKLYISETTVRATLRSVYGKLDIHSKAELCLQKF